MVGISDKNYAGTVIIIIPFVITHVDYGFRLWALPPWRRSTSHEYKKLA